jgi:hypothetical protein
MMLSTSHKPLSGGVGFLHLHVEAGAADLARPAGGNQVVLVDQIAPGDVDDEGGIFHGGEFVSVHEAPRLRRRWHADQYRVGLGKRLMDALARENLVHQFVGLIGAGDADHPHVEGLRFSRHGLARGAHADDAHGLAAKRRDLGGNLIAQPLVVRPRRLDIPQAVRRCQQQRKGVLGEGWG